MHSFAFVTPYYPAPDNTGGRIRMHRLARALSHLGPVDLFACVHPIEQRPASGDPTVALAPYRHRTLVPPGLGAVLPWVHPRRVVTGCPLRLRRALFAAHRTHRYRAVIACHSYAYATARALPGCLHVVDEHNVESRYAAAVYPDERLEARLLERWERQVWQRADLLSVVTDADAAHVRAHTDREVMVCPNGADLDRIAFRPPSQRSGHTMVFVGAMSHPPNVAAAIELVREVLPRVRAVHTDARVILCGRAPSPEVSALASDAVEVTGTVDDPAECLARASVSVNLVRSGAGSSLKVPEALAAGLSLVATDTAVRGFDLHDGAHLLVRTRADSIADAVLACWADPAAADARAERAMTVVRRFDWTSLSRAWAERILAYCDTRGPR